MSKKYKNGQDPVFEVKVIVTMLAQGDERETKAYLANMDLAGMRDAISDGGMIGSYQTASVLQLAESDVVPALEAVDNDGEFFNMDEEPFPREDAQEPDARILRTQMEQGWNSESLNLKRKSFIDGMGLSDTFARWLEGEAEFENAMSADILDP